MIRFLYPHGKTRAITFSYDDGQIFDRRLVELMNEYQLKGTFHLNAGTLDKDGFVSKEEVRQLYKGHEVSGHTLTHPVLNVLCRTDLVHEVLEDRRILEEAKESIVRGISYPFGVYSKEVIDTLRDLGVEYARTVENTGKFFLPEDFLCWHPSCHHNELSKEMIDKFLNAPKYRRCYLLYVWGHSYEFDKRNNWEFMEEMCELLAYKEDVWYATNIEIKDYVMAMRSLKVSLDGKRIYNPTDQRIWIEEEDGTIRILLPGMND